MSCTKLLFADYLDTDQINANSVSSQQTNFEDDYLYDGIRRSKVWRSDGYWNITSSNNTIVFEETASTPLTATIAVSEYTSNTSLYAAIKTALEAAGGSTYTVSQGTGGRLKILSDLAGGGGIFNLLWTSDTAFGDLVGFDTASDDTGAAFYEADTLVIHENEWIKWDLGMPSNPKAFVAIGNRNSPIQLTPNGTYILEGNETDVWTSPSYQKTLTYYGSVIAEIDDTGLHTEELRFWRLTLLDAGNTDHYLELSSIYLGDAETMARGAVNFPFGGNYLDRSSEFITDFGNEFVDIKAQTHEYNLQWNGLTKADKEIFDDLMNTVGLFRPFYIQVDADSVLSDTSNYYLLYVRMVANPNWEIVSPNNFELTMRVREQI